MFSAATFAVAAVAVAACAIDEAGDQSSDAACAALSDPAVLALGAPSSADALREAADAAPAEVMAALERLIVAADDLADLDPAADTTQALSATILTDPEIQSAQASVQAWRAQACSEDS